MILSIGLATALFVSLELTTKTALYSAMRAYTEYVGDFDMFITKGNFELFNESTVIQKVRNFSEVYAIGPRLLFGATLDKNGTTTNIVVVGINVSIEESIGSFEIVEGTLNLSKKTCMVLESVANIIGVGIGDNISIWFYDTLGALRVEFLIVEGIVRQYGKLPADLSSVLFVDLGFAQEILSADGQINFLVVKLKPSLVDPGDAERSIKNIVSLAEKIQMSIGFEFSVTPIKAQILSSVSEGLMFQRILYDSFASITMFMAVLLVLMISLMNMHDRLREIGILRALGASRIRIFALSLSETLVVGIIGGGVGLSLGVIAYYMLRRMLMPQLLLEYAEGFFILRYEVLLGGVLVSISIAVLGGIYPAIKASMVLPREALQPAARRVKLLETIEKKISPEAIDTRFIVFGVGVLGSISMIVFALTMMMTTNSLRSLTTIFFFLVLVVVLGIISMFLGIFPKIAKMLSIILSVPFKTISRLAGRNILRYKHRSIILFFMLSLVVASLFTINFLVNTQIKATEKSIKLSVGADIVVYGREPLPENITKLLEQVEGIESYCPVTFPISVKIGDVVYWRSATARIYGIEPHNYTRTTYIEDFGLNIKGIEKIASNMSAMISRGLAEFLDVGIGDTLRFEYRGETFLLNVSHISTKAPGFVFTTYASRAQGTDIIVSLNTFRNITGNIWFSRILIRVKSSSSVDSVVEAIIDAIGEEYDIQVVSVNEYLERSKEALLSLESILSTLLSFAVFVAIMGEILSVVATIKERVWEIGVLRAIGAKRRHIAMIFMLEAIVISFMGFLAGLAAAYIMVYEVDYMINAIGEVGVPVVVSMDMLLRVLLIVSIPTTLLAYLLAYVLSGRNVAEILARAERV